MAASSRRIVLDNQIISPALPAVRISIDPSFTYVGGPSFELYGIAHAEQHLFVSKDEQHVLHRLLWVQFEGFLPDNQRSYRYTVTQTVELAGRPFIYDISTLDIDHEVAQRPDSDLAAALAYLQEDGYQMTGKVQAQRFVHLIGEDKRNELMIIYGERAREAGCVPTALAHERALASFRVEFL